MKLLHGCGWKLFLQYHAVPHLAARSITSKAHLHALLLELQGAGLIREVHQELAGDPLFAAFHVYTFTT
jgi:5,10-methylenetetrahydrofolate reductase